MTESARGDERAGERRRHQRAVLKKKESALQDPPRSYSALALAITVRRYRTALPPPLTFTAFSLCLSLCLSLSLSLSLFHAHGQRPALTAHAPYQAKIPSARGA